jgi:hypothetical protein
VAVDVMLWGGSALEGHPDSRFRRLPRQIDVRWEEQTQFFIKNQTKQIKKMKGTGERGWGEPSRAGEREEEGKRCSLVGQKGARTK